MISSEILKVGPIQVKGQESASNLFKQAEKTLRTTARSNERRINNVAVELVPLPVDDDDEFEEELDLTHRQIIDRQDGVEEPVDDDYDPYAE